MASVIVRGLQHNTSGDTCVKTIEPLLMGAFAYQQAKGLSFGEYSKLLSSVGQGRFSKSLLIKLFHSQIPLTEKTRRRLNAALAVVAANEKQGAMQ